MQQLPSRVHSGLGVRRVRRCGISACSTSVGNCAVVQIPAVMFLESVVVIFLSVLHRRGTRSFFAVSAEGMACASTYIAPPCLSRLLHGGFFVEMEESSIEAPCLSEASDVQSWEYFDRIWRRCARRMGDWD